MNYKSMCKLMKENDGLIPTASRSIWNGSRKLIMLDIADEIKKELNLNHFEGEVFITIEGDVASIYSPVRYSKENQITESGFFMVVDDSIAQDWIVNVNGEYYK